MKVIIRDVCDGKQMSCTDMESTDFVPSVGDQIVFPNGTSDGLDVVVTARRLDYRGAQLVVELWVK